MGLFLPTVDLVLVLLSHTAIIDFDKTSTQKGGFVLVLGVNGYAP